MDATNESPELNWIHVFPLGVGRAAAGARSVTFNGRPMRDGGPFSRAAGIRWWSRTVVVAQGITGTLVGNRPTFLKAWHCALGEHGGAQVALVDDIAGATRLATDRLAPRRHDAQLLTEWSLAIVHVHGVERLALHHRAVGEAELHEFHRALERHAGLEWVATFSGAPKPPRPSAGVVRLSDPPGQSTWDPLTVTDPAGRVIAAIDGLAVAWDLEPTPALTAIVASATSARG